MTRPECTWPMEADAMGTGEKSTKRDRQSEPSSAVMAFCDANEKDTKGKESQFRSVGDVSLVRELTLICQSGM